MSLSLEGLPDWQHLQTSEPLMSIPGDKLNICHPDVANDIVTPVQRKNDFFETPFITPPSLVVL